MSEQKRDTWVDAVKLFACILVVLGHFAQSMVTAGLYPASSVYRHFISGIYSFHVPLFFICSGYLYQKYNRGTWKNTVVNKAISLGIPYVIFSALTWLLKTLFAGSVNNPSSVPLWRALLLEPISPYWYLYVLFFMFVLIPVLRSKAALWGVFLAAFIVKLAGIFLDLSAIYLLDRFADNAFWFCGGMVLSQFSLPPAKKPLSLSVSSCAVAAFLILCIFVPEFKGSAFIWGLLACAGFIGLLVHVKPYSFIGLGAKYTMPVFLMHTLVAAPVRVILTRLGIADPAAHTVIGLAASFAGPVLVALLLDRIPFTNFILYPGKYIKLPKEPKA